MTMADCAGYHEKPLVKTRADETEEHEAAETNRAEADSAPHAARTDSRLRSPELLYLGNLPAPCASLRRSLTSIKSLSLYHLTRQVSVYHEAQDIHLAPRVR